MTVRAPVQAHAPLCDTLSALLLRARGDGETAPRAVLAMEHMEPMEQACSLVITPTLAMEHMQPMEPLELEGEAEGGESTRGQADGQSSPYPYPYP